MPLQCPAVVTPIAPVVLCRTDKAPTGLSTTVSWVPASSSLGSAADSADLEVRRPVRAGAETGHGWTPSPARWPGG
ncbi:hypothetical protein [Micromonospora sp. CPCC 206061]|uniref:hypothetical protein n=1 Tax=Micromonospora sp. CPCC 206061 TaxID=3122410 RepID=UPI002FF1A0C3